MIRIYMKNGGVYTPHQSGVSCSFWNPSKFSYKIMPLS
jgi:hypothetical protein